MKLEAFNKSDGTVEIHKAGCADVKRNNKRRGGHFRQDQVEFGNIDYPTKYAFAYDYWNNGILEEHEAEFGPMDVMVEMDFQPCTADLREGSRAEHLGEAEPAKPKTKLEVRREVREVLYNSMMKDLEGMKADVENGYQPQMYADLMAEQIERVAYMFGMRDEK
jgi:hypothetical protein